MDSHPEYDRVREAVRSVQAPMALREQIETRRERTLVRRMVVRRLKLAGVLSAGAAVLGIVVGLAMGGGAPSALEATAFASAKPESGPPAFVVDDPEHLDVRVGDVVFPSWSETPWRVSGARDDELDGREARTVFYDLEGMRVGYTVVEGKLDWPDGTTERDGIRVLRRGDDLVAFWRVNGETCVLVAPASVGEGRLVKMTRY
jgi:hypothetical protein